MWPPNPQTKLREHIESFNNIVKVFKEKYKIRLKDAKDEYILRY